MSERRNYPFTSPRQSAERLALIKIDQIIAALQEIVTKLDADAGVTPANYTGVLAQLKTMRESIGIREEDFKT